MEVGTASIYLSTAAASVKMMYMTDISILLLLLRLTAAFSWLLLNERFGLQGFVGAGCILLGVVVSSLGTAVTAVSSSSSSKTSPVTADNDTGSM